MPNQQRNARKALTDWLKVFRQIKLHGSRVEAVSQLVSFGKEMEEELAQPLTPTLPLELAQKLRTRPNRFKVGSHKLLDDELDRIAQASIDAAKVKIAEPKPELEVVGDTEPAETYHPRDLLGVADGGDRSFASVAQVETVTAPPFLAPVLVPAFPDETELTLIGSCPNPRLLQGELPDHRKVRVWKGPRHWRIPSKVMARRDVNTPPTEPIYLPV